MKTSGENVKSHSNVRFHFIEKSKILDFVAKMQKVKILLQNLQNFAFFAKRQIANFSYANFVTKQNEKRPGVFCGKITNTGG